MTKTRTIITLLVISVVCWLAVAGWALVQGRLGSAMNPIYADIFSVTATSADYIYEAESNSDGLPADLSGAILPAPQNDSAVTAEGFATLSAAMKAKVLLFVTVGDGFDAVAATSYRDWQTAFGIIQISGEIVWELTECGAAIDDEAVYAAEGLTAAVPYVSRYYPDARIVPLVLNSNASETEINALLAQFGESGYDYGVAFISAPQGLRGDLTKADTETLKNRWAQCSDTAFDELLDTKDTLLLKAAAELCGNSGNSLCKVVKPQKEGRLTFGNLLLYYGQ